MPTLISTERPHYATTGRCNKPLRIELYFVLSLGVGVGGGWWGGGDRITGEIWLYSDTSANE